MSELTTRVFWRVMFTTSVLYQPQERLFKEEWEALDYASQQAADPHNLWVTLTKVTEERIYLKGSEES